MRVVVPIVAIALLLVCAPVAHAAAETGGGGNPIVAALGDAFGATIDRFFADSPPAVVGNFILKGLGWLAFRFAENQTGVAGSSPLIEIDRRMVTQNPGVIAGFAAFSGIIGGWVALSAAWNGIRCMVSVGRSAVGETITAVGPGIIIPVLLALNGLPLMDYVIQVANLFSRAIFFGTSGNPVADILTTGSRQGINQDPNAAMGAYVLSLGVMFFLMALSRMAVHGVAAMCAITFVPAMLCMMNGPTQWVFKTWMVFACGSFLGHILQAAALRAGAGMMASAFSGNSGAVGTSGQLQATLAAIATMALTTMIPGLVGMGVAAHSFGMGTLLSRLFRRGLPQRTKEVPPDQPPTQDPGTERMPRAQAEEVPTVRGTILPPRMAPVRPSSAPTVIVMESPPPARPALPAPRD